MCSSDLAAAEAMEGFLARQPGGEGRAYLDWVRAGHRDRAEAVLAHAPDDALARMDTRTLDSLAEDLARYGREALLDDLLARYRKGNEGIASADETVGRIQVSLGRHEAAIESLSRLPVRGMSDEARAALLTALWRTGHREKAMSVALSGLDEGPRQPSATGPKSWSRVVLAFLLSEGASAEALQVLDRVLEKPEEAASDLRLLRARLRVRSGKAGDAEKARTEFLELLPRLDAASDEAFRYVRDEVREGRGTSLTDALATVRGSRAAEARFLAACLSGRREVMAEMRRTLADAEPAGPGILLAGARAALECGRFQDAGPLAMQALKAMPRDVDPSEASRIALVAGRMLDQRPEKAVEELLSSRSEDPVTIQEVLAEAREQSGDEAGRAKALLERARWLPADPSAAMAAVESALRAGDGALRKEAERLVLEATDDRPQWRLRLADLYTRSMRDDLAAEILSSRLPTRPGDSELAGRTVLAFLRAGNVPAATTAAEEFAARHGDRREAAAVIVTEASSEMAPELVRKWLDVAAAGPPDQATAYAVWHAARMAARIGDTAAAEAWARKAATLATDPIGLEVLAAQAVLADPELPASLAGWTGSGSPQEGPDERHPAPGHALACGESATAEEAARCAAGMADLPGTPALLVAACDRALAGGRFEAAKALAEAADRLAVGSAMMRRALGSRILSYLGEAAESPLAARRALGSMALGWIREDRVPRDADGGALTAHLSEMALGLRVGIQTYEREIALAPADASLRNNLAYLLSMAGGDLERALREARTASTLSPRGAAYYLETEAWARFLREGANPAIPLQERARRTWRIDQGGGVAEGLYHLGRMLEAAGRPAAAREAYRRASLLEPSDSSGVRSLRRWRTLESRSRRP